MSDIVYYDTDSVIAGNPVAFTTTLKNIGTAAVNGYTVNLKDASGTLVAAREYEGSIASGETEIPGGILYDGNAVYLSADPEVPIPGFLIISSKRHVSSFSQLNFVTYFVMKLISLDLLNSLKKLMELKMFDLSNSFVEKYHLDLELNSLVKTKNSFVLICFECSFHRFLYQLMEVLHILLNQVIYLFVVF